MKDIKDFFKGVPKSIWLIMIVLIVIICSFPVLFTKLPFCFFDFSQTGPIGDTIGGIIGPFIAILAAFLTFVAFWAQFEANRELIKENRRNHFENRFYKMLDIHLDNVLELNNRINKMIDTDSAFHSWCIEIENLFNLLKTEGDFGGVIDEILNKYRNDPEQKEFCDYLYNLKNTKDEYYKVVFNIAYVHFYDKGFSTLRYGDDKQSSFIRQFAVILIAKHELVMKKTKDSYYSKNELLGRYFRHLFQIVSFVAGQEDDLFDNKEWKGSYLSILRSQMSDYEQLLLYYNAQTTLGEAWDENHYIEGYKLIKNIPFYAIAHSAGETPYDRYYDAIKAAESRGGRFFERG